jgi:hypothetical protein
VKPRVRRFAPAMPRRPRFQLHWLVRKHALPVSTRQRRFKRRAADTSALRCGPHKESFDGGILVSKATGSQSRWPPRRWLAVAVAFLFVIIATCLSFWVLGPRPGQYGSADESYLAGKLLGMDIGWKKGPLMLLLDKGFPRKNSFALCDDSQRLTLFGEDADGGDSPATKEAGIGLGTDFEMRCFYSLDKGIAVHELWLTRKDDSLLDLNADGVFDVRVQIPPEKPHLVQVMYDGQWRDTVDGSKYRKQLRDGGEVEFDMHSGRWLPPTKAPGAAEQSAP